MLVFILALCLTDHALCTAKRTNPQRPGLFQPSRLVLEMTKIEPCDEPGNALVFYNIRAGMISKVDFAVSADFNVTRAARIVDSLLIRITKCREMVSSNTCELFQTWRFDKNPCKGMTEPSAPWHTTWLTFKPRPTCPFKVGSYEMHNLTIGAGVVDKVPLPWEGNVWLIRFGVLDTKTRFHLCTDTEFRAHRVRE